MLEKVKEQCVLFFKEQGIPHHVLFSSTKLMHSVQNEQVMRYDHFLFLLIFRFHWNRFKSNLIFKYYILNAISKIGVSDFVDLLALISQ